MSYFIIIRGPLGSGKSTISAKLSQLLKAEHIHTDEILEHNGLDTVPEGAPCIPKENFIKANEIILPKVKKNLQAGIPVIFDACFYHQEVIEHLIKNLPFNHYIFTLKAPLDLCIKRDAERPKSHGEGAAMAVHSLVSRFDYGTNIDVTGTLNQSVENVRDHLPRFKKIVVLDKVTLSAGIVKQLDPFSETPIEIFGTDPADNSEIIKRITDADCILLTWRTPITKEIIEACPELKFICLCATNSNLIDLEECAKHNITISNIKDYGDEGVVEWIFCQLITLVRGLGKHQWRDQISEIGEKKSELSEWAL